MSRDDADSRSVGFLSTEDHLRWVAEQRKVQEAAVTTPNPGQPTDDEIDAVIREHLGGMRGGAMLMYRTLARALLATKASAGDAAPASASKQQAPNLLAAKHEGMRVDYSGLLGQCQRALRNRGEGANAEMLRQLQGHLKELGERWYAGDTAVVDEILQLYCIEKDARTALLQPKAQPPESVQAQQAPSKEQAP